MESLRGKLLLAGPTLTDPNFRRTVVLLTEHGEDGAMGLVLNRPSSATIGEAVPSLDWLDAADAIVHVGGPVAPTGVIVLAEWRRPALAGVLVDGDLGFLAGDPEDAAAVLDAMGRVRVFAGHSGWAPGQLEGELEQDAWIVAERIPDDVFTDDPEALWAAVLKRKGRSFALLATMPLDPSLN
jgi:putative transcriptional regulator